MNSNFKRISIEDVLFVDIETVRKSETLRVGSPEFKMYQYKLRNRETDELPTDPQTQEDYEKRAALRLGYNRIVTIGIGYVRAGEIYIKSLVGPEHEILQEFFRITRSFKFISGYNLIGFDLPVCNFNASAYFDITEYINPDFNVSAKKPWELKSIIDLMEVVKGTHFYNPSLEEVLFHYGIPSSKSGISGAQVSEVYYKEGLEPIQEYVKKDILATINLFNRLQGSQKTWTEYIDRSEQPEPKTEPKDPLVEIYESDYLSDSAKQSLAQKLQKKKLTKADRVFVEDVLKAVYINDDMMAGDSKDTIEAKIREIQEFLNNTNG